MRLNGNPVIDWAILKIAQRCNINCDYCYVYNRGDSSWSARPVFVKDEVIEAFCAAVARHCKAFELPQFHIELHGGEPLLLGKRRFDALCQKLATECGVEVRFHLQTNGLLLDEEWIALFDRYHISFGVSLDGPPELHDLHRVDHFGRGTGGNLIVRLHELSASSEFHRWFGGALCVISAPVPDGRLLVDWFVENGIRDFDFLMPDGNWANLPPQWPGVAPFSEFWLSVYERWKELGAQAPKIRTIETMLRGVAGAKSSMDAHGGDIRSMIIVESDGSIGVSDVGRICDPLNQDRHNILRDEIRFHQEREDLAEIQELPTTCRQCPHLGACGGGYLPHRFDGVGFGRESLYCEAWTALISQMKADIQAELQAAA